LNKNKYKFTHIPIHYQQSREIDERFLEVKVYVLHLGENYNGSIFTKDVVTYAIPSLANTPLLAFVKRNENEKDFAGHEIDLVIEQGEYKWKYTGQAYGVIPERNNARWEFMTGDDGIEREYLVVDAIVWKKFDDAVEIITRDLSKGQSMELSEKYSGHFDENGLFVFDQFKFDGCAILGNNVEPAMNSAKIEMKFSMDTLKNTISEMMNEYTRKFSKEVKQVNIEELLKKYGFTRDQVIEAGIEIHTYTDDDLEKFKEELERIKNDLDEAEKKQTELNEDKKDNIENKNEDINDNALDNKDNPLDNKDNSDFDKKDEKSEEDKNEAKKKEESKEDVAKSSKNAKQDDKKSNDEKEFSHDDDEKAKDELKQKYSKLEEDYQKVIEERDELVKYKKNREKDDHKAKVEALISSFEKLTDSDVKDIREKLYHFTVDEVEEKLYAILGKKQASDKVKKSTQFAKFYVSNDSQEAERKPSYDHLFEKHLKK
jgi:hypothetical protein